MSLFSSLKPVAQYSRNVFDRSRTESFSTKLGMGTPCFVEHTVPNGKYKIDVSDICRVDTQVTANFVGLNQCFDFFFVPYSQLWRSFNNFFYGKGERTRNTGSIPSGQPVYAPTFSIFNVVSALFSACLAYNLYNQYVNYCIANGVRVDNAVLTWAKSRYLIYDSSHAPDYSDGLFYDIHGRFCGYDQLRMLDMLGYGNYLPLLKYAYPPQSDATVVGAFNTLIGGDDSQVEGMITSWLGRVSNSIPNTRANSFALQAYVKVFNDIYMNRIYPEYHLEQLYNVDYFAGTSPTGLSDDAVICALRPWFRMYKKDLFTALYPDPQFGNVSVAGVEYDSGLRLRFPNVAAASSNVETNLGGVVVANSSSGLQLENNLTGQPAQFRLSALAIRQALCFQKYKETLLRAGNREKDLQRAVFGVGSHYIEDKYVDFLGSFQSVIQQSPVAATSEYNDVNIGELGAYSVGSINMGSQKEIEFDAKDFGVILGICYVMPETKYEATGIDPHNTKFEPDDYFNEKIQNLGLHPVYKHQAVNMGFGGNTFTDSVLGYMAEYSEYKTAVSKVHGEFFGSNPAISLDFMNLSGYDASEAAMVQISSFGSFAHFVAPRDVRDVAGGTKEMLYIAPWDCDRVFSVSEGVEQSLDHFKFEATFRCKAVLPMSEVGLPQ